MGLAEYESIEMPKEKKVPLTEAQLFARLKKRYDAPEYAIFPSVQNTTGFSRQRREADAIAMGLWPSRGMEVLGFEIKSRRSDWLAELRKVSKSAAIQKYCNRWWIVAADKDVVKLEAGELPPTWGLMVPRGKNQLVTVVEAPPLEPEPLDRGFIAALLRRAQEASQRPDLEEKIRAELRPVLEESFKRVRDIEFDQMKRKYEEMEQKLERYKKASAAVGIHYGDWHIDDLAKSIKYLKSHGPGQVLKDIKRQKSILEGVQVEMADAIAELEKMQEKKT